MSKYITNTQISKMTYNQLGALVAKGELTIERLKSYYVDARRKATDRARKIEKSEFAEIEENPYFRKLKSLTTDSDLLHEVSDVNRYLKSEKSTISGQKRTREKLKEVASNMGFEVSDEDYIQWRQFMAWFQNSEYAVMYDSDAEELQEAFQEGSSASDWKSIFESFVERDRQKAENGNNKR